MKKIFLSVAILLLLTATSFAQTVFTPGGTIGTSSNSFVGIGTSSPSSDLHLAGSLPSFSITHTGSVFNYGDYGINIGNNGSVKTRRIPACGSGDFIVKGDPTYGNTITFRGSRISFGTQPYCEGGSGGTFNFGGGNVWVNDTLVISPYNNTPGVIDYSAPIGYRLAVNGSASFSDQVVIGSFSSFTQGFPSGYKLYVADGILTEKVRVAVKTTTDWADYVFSDNYSLMPLKEVEQFVKTNSHLPNVPSAQEVVNGGIDVAKMDAKLLEKIEELTLYIIEQNKKLEEQESRIKFLESKN